MMFGFVLAATVAIPPSPTNYVTDKASALSPATAQALESELRDFKTKTGDQILVYIDQTTGDEALETWTVKAAQAWHAGQKGKDNGAVLFVFMKDHKLRIEVGYGLESTLTDADASEIIRNTITPSMKSGNVDAAISGGVNAMLAVIDPTFAAPSSAPNSSSEDSDDATGGAIVLLVLGVVAIGLIFALILTIVRRGKKHGDWLDAWMFVGGSGGGSSGGSWWSSGGGGGGFSGFSGGGGSFGGGGASGGW